MFDAVSNTSPILYMFRTGLFNWLPRIFNEIWIPNAVVEELGQGKMRGYEVPGQNEYEWLKIVEPKSIPFDWLSSDLGKGEIGALALALENPDRVVLLDDLLARNIAKAAGLEVWGTLRILLEVKAKGLADRIEPVIGKFEDKGMWISEDIRNRILKLAGELEVD